MQKWYQRNRVKRRGQNRVAMQNWRTRTLQRRLRTHPKPKLCELKCGRRATHFDHNHKTGAFRGWLCLLCNSALGFLKDDPALCRRAESYLRRHQCRKQPSATRR